MWLVKNVQSTSGSLGFHALSSLGVEWFLGFRRVYKARNRSGGSGCPSDLVGSEVWGMGVWGFDC